MIKLLVFFSSLQLILLPLSWAKTTSESIQSQYFAKAHQKNRPKVHRYLINVFNELKKYESHELKSLLEKNNFLPRPIDIKNFERFQKEFGSQPFKKTQVQDRGDHLTFSTEKGAFDLRVVNFYLGSYSINGHHFSLNRRSLSELASSLSPYISQHSSPFDFFVDQAYAIAWVPLAIGAVVLVGAVSAIVQRSNYSRDLFAILQDLKVEAGDMESNLRMCRSSMTWDRTAQDLPRIDRYIERLNNYLSGFRSGKDLSYKISCENMDSDLLKTIQRDKPLNQAYKKYCAVVADLSECHRELVSIREGMVNSTTLPKSSGEGGQRILNDSNPTGHSGKGQ